MDDFDDDDISSVDDELLQVYAKLEEDALKQKREQHQQASAGGSTREARRCPETSDMSAPLTGKIIKIQPVVETVNSDNSRNDDDSAILQPTSAPANNNNNEAKPSSSPPAPKETAITKTSPFFSNSFESKALDEAMLESSDDSDDEEDQEDNKKQHVPEAAPAAKPLPPKDSDEEEIKPRKTVTSSSKVKGDASTRTSSSSSSSSGSSSSSSSDDDDTASGDAPSASKQEPKIPKVIKAIVPTASTTKNETIDLTEDGEQQQKKNASEKASAKNATTLPQASKKLRKSTNKERKKTARGDRDLSSLESDLNSDDDILALVKPLQKKNKPSKVDAAKKQSPSKPPEQVDKKSEDDSSSSASDTPDLLPKVTQTTQEARPSPDIQEYIPDTQDDGEPEIDESQIALPPYQPRPPPRLQLFTTQTHPPPLRQKVQVSQWFQQPVSLLWKNKFEEFNQFQSQISQVMCGSDDNVVVSAPTGAGKSTVFEMAMARFFQMNLQAEMQYAEEFCSRLSKSRKILYIAPSKALCEERYDDWSRRLHSMGLGIEVAMITGDAVDPGTSFSELINAHFVITTPEKWDSMTRRWTENFYLLASVKLLLVDEVHFLCDENRGWCLEAVVTRMKTIHQIARSLEINTEDLKSSSYPATNPAAIRSTFRMVAVSATLPKMEEFADFFMANEAYSFDESYRPVPLEKYVLSMGGEGKNSYTFWSNLKQQVPAVLQRFRQGKQCLIFCHSKKDAEYVANDLIQKRTFANKNGFSRAQKGSIQYFIDMGVGYHHAGLEKEERNGLEQAFANGQIKCLACTSTLAQGVNTPAGLVLIVGTKAYRGNGYEEVETSQLLQMIGRAGRPGQDDSGTAVILTDKDSVRHIQRRLNSGLGVAKSKLISHLPEAMNSEISNRVIGSLEDSLNWFQSTFLFCCMNRSARRDTISEAAKLCEEAVNRLKRIDLVRLNQDIVERQPGCHVMNKHMLSLQAMSAIASWSSKSTECQILRSLSTLETLQFPVKRDQKKELKEIHKTDVIRYKCVEKQLSKFTVKHESQKAFILLQAIISQHEFKDKLLKQQMSSVTNSATAILSAAQEFCFKATKFSTVAKICFQLHRSLMVCLWDIDGGALNQIDGVGLTAVRMLRFQGIHSFQHVLESSEEKLERASGRGFPFGRDLKQTVQGIMRDNLMLSAKIEYTRDSNTPAGLIISLKDPEDARTAMTPKDKESSISFTLIASIDNPHGSLLMVKENVVTPTSFRVMLPPNVQNVAVSKLASMVGFDETVDLDTTNEPEEPSTQPQPTRRSFPPSEARKRTNTSRKRKSRQLETSFGSQKKCKSRNTTTQLDPSPTITPPRSENQNVRNRRQESWNGESERQFPSNNLEASPFAAAVRQYHASPFRPSNVTPQVPRQDHTFHSTGSTTDAGHNSGVPSQIETRQNPPLRTQHRPARDISNFCSSQQSSENAVLETPSLKDSAREWRKTQQKASQSQKRAYTHKKENPFGLFRHDPNATEEKLTLLSKKSASKPFRRNRDLRRGRQRHSVDPRELMHSYAETMEEDRRARAHGYAPSYNSPNPSAFHDSHGRQYLYDNGPPQAFSPPPPAGVPYPDRYAEPYVEPPTFGHSESFTFSQQRPAQSRGGWESTQGGYNPSNVMRHTPPPNSMQSYNEPRYSQQSAFAHLGTAYEPASYQEHQYPPSRYGGQSFAGSTHFQQNYQPFGPAEAHQNLPPPEIEFRADHQSFQSNDYQNTAPTVPQGQFGPPSHDDFFENDIF